MYLVLVWGLATAAITTLVLVPPLQRLARSIGWVDHPDGLRKLHLRSTPYLGGVAIAVGFGTGYSLIALTGGEYASAFASYPIAFWVGAAAMLLSGIYDDVLGLSFKYKLVLQVLVAYMLLHAGYQINASDLPFIPADPYNHTLLAAPVTILWIVAVINAFNLIDGMDGLAGGVAVAGFASLAFIYGLKGEFALVALAVPMIGAIAGFLRYNFYPASIFMGDAGSMFIGYMFAVYALKEATHSDPWIALVIPVFAIGLPVLDITFSALRRTLTKRTIFEADCNHIHHRLQFRLSTSGAALVLYGISAFFGGTAVAMSLMGTAYGLALAFLTVILIPFGLSFLGYSFPPVEPDRTNAADVPPSRPHKPSGGQSLTERRRDIHTAEHKSLGPIETN